MGEMEFGEKQQKRFWSKVAIGGADECWPWTATVNPDGYGTFSYLSKTIRAHRFAVMTDGRDVTGLVVRHTCDNPVCVNPRHLILGTHTDNMRDLWSRGRQNGSPAANATQETCPRGHALVGYNLIIKRRGDRNCRTCHNLREKESYAKKRATGWKKLRSQQGRNL